MHLALNFQHVDPKRGGAETYVADLCKKLTEAGHRVDLYAETVARGSIAAAVNVINVPVTGKGRLARIQSFARNSAALVEQAHQDCSVGFINTYSHDVIIPQGGVHQASLMANSLRFSSPTLQRAYRLGKMLNPKYWSYRSIENKQYDAARSARVIAVSEMVKGHLEEYHQVPSRWIHVVPNAIDPERIRVSQPGAVRCAFRNKMGYEPGDIVGLFVGHNFALKGLRPLLEALGERRRNPGARTIHLLVSGGGNIAPYRRLAKRLGLSETVRFLGFYPDVNACYRSSDFFVQPTYYDPCSLVVLEALACGLPVITTSRNGASELMTDGREGFILTAPDARGELIAALNGMTIDSRRIAMAVEAARLGARQTFDLHVSRLVTVFEEVARSRSGRSLPHSRKRGSRSNSRQTGGARS
jgi:UDP-glucose:(heptosyl)LPS alpha-1,3-glucosyltransferase